MQADADLAGRAEDVARVVQEAIAGRADGADVAGGGLVAAAAVDRRVAAEIASDSTSRIECGGCDAGWNNGEA